MSLFSALSSLAGSFSGIYHESSEIGLSSRMGDSLMSGGSGFQESKFGETLTSSTMSSNLDGFTNSF